MRSCERAFGHAVGHIGIAARLAPMGVTLVIGLAALGACSKPADEAAFRIAGEPCPAATHEELVAQHQEPTRSVDFREVSYSRRLGHAECDWVDAKRHFGDKGYAACEFTSPGSLEVKTKKGVYGFLPGAGRPATVAIIDDVPQCAIGGNSVPAMLKAAGENAK